MRSGNALRRERPKPDPPKAPQFAEPLSPLVLLKEMFDLLEEYAPLWYTEELHNRAADVLKIPR